MIQDRIALIENPLEGEEKVPEGGPEEVLLKQIQAVLYSTEDGFEVPEGQEVSAAPSAAAQALTEPLAAPAG